MPPRRPRARKPAERMARHTEPAVNNSLGTLLQGMLPRSHVRSENTQAIVGHSGLRPDILITAPGRSPVVIEAEYLPAATAEVEAKERLGLDVAEDGRRIEAVIALRYPIDMGDADDLRAALTESRISWCVFTEESAGVTRFPSRGGSMAPSGIWPTSSAWYLSRSVPWMRPLPPCRRVSTRPRRSSTN